MSQSRLNQKLRSQFSIKKISHLQKKLKRYNDPETDRKWKIYRRLDERLSMDFILSMQHSIQSNQPSDVDDIMHFLAQRWDLIRSTRYAYQALHQHPLNHFFICLAKLISDIKAVSPFLILMPTLRVKNYIVSGESLEDFAFEPWRFVLSDDNTTLIPVEKTLTFSAQFSIQERETILYHLHMEGLGSDALTPEELSLDEYHRVIFHSRATRHYFQNKNQLLIESNCGNTLGAQVKKLREGLRFGGVHSRGTASEYNAGHEANLAIHEFHEFFENALTPNEKKFLTSLQAIEDETAFTQFPDIDPIEASNDIQGEVESSEEQELNFGYYWQKLTRPPKSKDGGTSYCVELIGDGIDSILAQHSILFDTVPKKARDIPKLENKIAKLTKRCAKSEKKLLTELNNPSYVVDHSYSLETSLLRFAKRVAKLLVSENTPTHQRISMLEYLQEHKFFDILLTSLPTDSVKYEKIRIAILNVICDHADITIKSFSDLQTLLKAAIRQKCRPAVINRLPLSKWCELSETTADKLNMMSLLYPNPNTWLLVTTDAEKNEIAQFVLENPRKLILSGTAFQRFVEWLPKVEQSRFLDQFELAYLADVLKMTDHLEKILALFSNERQIHLLALSKKRSIGSVSMSQLLKAYLSLLNQSRHASQLLSFISLETLFNLTPQIDTAVDIISFLPAIIRWDYLTRFIDQHAADQLTFRQLKRLYRYLTTPESITLTQSIDIDALIRRNDIGDLATLLRELDKLEPYAGNAYDILIRKAFDYHLPLMRDAITIKHASSSSLCFFRKSTPEQKALKIMQQLFQKQNVSHHHLAKYNTLLLQGELGSFYERQQHRLKPT